MNTTRSSNGESWLLINALTTLQRLSFHFIWENKRDFCWEIMVLHKKEEELGLIYFKKSAKPIAIKRLYYLWNYINFIWCFWIIDKYIQRRSINNIIKRRNANSSILVELFDTTGKFFDIFKNNTNYFYVWPCAG